MVGDGAGQLATEGEPAQVGGVAGRRVRGGPPAGALGLVHRHVGTAQQLGHPAAGRCDGDATAGLHADPHAVQFERLVQGGQQGVGPVRGHRRCGQPAQQDGELVAAEPGHQVARAGRGTQPVGHLHQYAVAGAVPEGVVDLLEVVEVDQHQGRDALGVAGGQLLGALVQQVTPVGEPGQRVVGGGVRVLLGDPGQLGVRLRVADRGAERGGEGTQGVLLPLGELDRPGEAEPEHTEVDQAVVPLKRQRDDRAVHRAGLGSRTVVRDPAGAAADCAVALAQLDLDLVGGEEFGGLGDGGGQHLVEVDHVERVGGPGKPLPGLLLGAAADAG